MKNIKKLSVIVLLLTFLFQGGMMNLFKGNKAYAASKPVYHIVTTSGADASQEITINWHSEKSGSYCLLTSDNDTGFDNAVRLYPTAEKLWSTENVTNAYKSDTFATVKRYVCYLELTDLIPGSGYRYKIVSDSYESGVYRFKTAEGTNKWSFIGFCDFQNHYNSVVHSLVNKLYNDFGKSPLAICSGDLVDTGAFEKEWSHLFDDYNTFNNLIFMSAPGDHEYHGNDTSPVPMMKETATFNNIFKNPGNGAGSSKNTSYYFHYNNVLFISLDFLDSNTVSGDRLNEEVTWFKETVKSLEGTFQYLIVYGHKSIYGSTSVDSGVITRIRPQWYPVFDECGVDLVLSGHDHEHSRTYLLYNNKKSNDPSKGTYYLDLGSSGNKRRALDGTTQSDGLHEKVIDIQSKGISLGALFDVSEDRIDVKCIDQNGNTQDNFVITPKRSAVSFTTQLESLGSYQIDNENDRMTITKEKVFPADIINDYQATLQNVTVNTYNNSTYVGTGAKIKYKSKTYTAVVKGDADGNGKITVTDYIMIKRYFLNTYSLSGVFFDAADTDGNGNVDSTDYLNIKMYHKKTSSLF